MGKVQTTHERSERGILRHVVESLGKDDGMREGHVSVQHTKCGSVQRTRGQETRHQVDIPWCIAIRRDIQSQVGNDLVCSTLSVDELMSRHAYGKLTENFRWQFL